LLEGIERARGDDAAIVAVLWTWLESHLLALGSLKEKPPAIRRAAIKALEVEPYEGVGDETMAWLRERPLRNAAELLSRIGVTFESRGENLMERRKGVDGAEMVVAVRQPILIKAMGGGDFPPVSIEHPSLATLSPRLVVFPLELNGIELQIEDPEGEEWDLALTPLLGTGEGRCPEELRIHLDTLGEHGLSGWDPDPDSLVGRYNPEAVVAKDLEGLRKAASEAIERASGPSSLLLMPELAATPQVLGEIEQKLSKQADAPLMTFIGAYHRSPPDTPSVDPSLLGDCELAEHVNEAVAYGPRGEELWSQRKLSCAAGGATEPDERYVEDIRLGSRLTLVPTPLGTMAIVICLDAFAPHVRERLVLSPVELLMVPSLSPSIRRHRDSLQHLVHTLWGTAFVCNRSPYGAGSPNNPEGRSAWNDDRNRSFWVPDREANPAPGANPPDGHPSFVFSLNRDGDAAGGEE